MYVMHTILFSIINLLKFDSIDVLLNFCLIIQYM